MRERTMRSEKVKQNKSSGVDAVRRRVVFLAVPPVAELDLAGPLSVFQHANFTYQRCGRPPAYEMEVVTSGEDLTIAGECGLAFGASRRMNDARGPIDTLLVPGDGGCVALTPDDRAAVWLRRTVLRVRRFGSICTGAFALAAAGLLDDRRATTHWAFCEQMSTRYPNITVERDPIFVRDGNIYTSAGMTTGIDLALELVAQDLGSRVALDAARVLVVFLRRPGGQAQFSVSLENQTLELSSLRDLQAWIVDHLGGSLEVDELEERAAMSPRNFARVFTREVGMTPARYVLRQRVEAARRELEESPRGQDEIAARCGFGDAVRMRRVFLREMNVTPGRYRERFRQRGS